MADAYIDPFEAVTYGELSIDQIRESVMPLHEAWGSALERAIALQTEKNERVAALIGRIRRPVLDQAKIAEVKDAIMRFGSWLDSLKGRPLDPGRFFGTSTPSALAKRRMTKVAGQLQQMVNVLAPYTEGEGAIAGAASWLAELRAVQAVAAEQRDALSSARIAQSELTPELEQARLEWLSTYTANKRLVEGILRHHGKELLMPVIFDDLAEVQRSTAEGETEDGGSEDGGSEDGGVNEGGSNEELEHLTTAGGEGDDGPEPA